MNWATLPKYRPGPAEPAGRLKRVPAIIKEKYFRDGNGLLRLERDVRRMVIFGRGNVASDAPIGGGTHMQHRKLSTQILVFVASVSGITSAPRHAAELASLFVVLARWQQRSSDRRSPVAC